MTDTMHAGSPAHPKPAKEKGGASPAEADSGALPYPLVLRVRPPLELTPAQFFQICQQNDTLRLERTAEGDLVIMPPAGTPSGARNADLTSQLVVWAKRDGTGIAFDSSAGFTLPNGAERSPDASWILNERLAALTPEQRTGFWQICPDFVAELRSSSDRLSVVKEKMEEYRQNGARLGWLIDPEPRQVFVYRPGEPVERLDNPASVGGDPVLPGFTLDVRALFEIRL
jgi:Uma2 family endonuclease